MPQFWFLKLNLMQLLYINTCLVNTLQCKICSVTDRDIFLALSLHLNYQIYTVTSLRFVLFLYQHIMFPVHFPDALKLYFTTSHRLLSIF